MSVILSDHSPICAKSKMFSFSKVPILVAFLPLVSNIALGQLSLLSRGNPEAQWQTAQLQHIEQQLADTNVRGELRKELESQKTWLSTWASGKLSDSPWLDQASPGVLYSEPTIDPNKKAAKLREKLLGKNAKPTTADTDQLQRAMSTFPKDVGLRQLFLHWIDQKQYRAQYAQNVVEAAETVIAQLDRLDAQRDDIKLAKAYCNYRAARALIYMESEEYQQNSPIKDLKEHEGKLLGFYTELGKLVGHNRPEFILVELRMLCRDHWYGQALMLLEKYAAVIDRPWYLQYRYDLLKDLGWKQPAEEAQTIAQRADLNLNREARTQTGSAK